MSRSGVRAVIVIAASLGLGWLAGRLPSPDDATTFWIGNIGAPYLVIGFIAAGFATRRPVVGAIVGAASAVAAVLGFYNFVLVVVNARSRTGATPGTSTLTAIRTSVSQWLRLLTTSSRPWLTIAVVAGMLAGFLGARWLARGDRLGLFLIGAVLVIEPLIYLSGLSQQLRLTEQAYARSTHNIVIWGAEVVIGIGVLALAARPRAVGPVRDTTPAQSTEATPV